MRTVVYVVVGLIAFTTIALEGIRALNTASPGATLVSGLLALAVAANYVLKKVSPPPKKKRLH